MASLHSSRPSSTDIVTTIFARLVPRGRQYQFFGAGFRGLNDEDPRNSENAVQKSSWSCLISLNRPAAAASLTAARSNRTTAFARACASHRV